MHEIDDFNYYVISDRTEFLTEGDYVSNPKESTDENTDITKTTNIWLDNIGWL